MKEELGIVTQPSEAFFECFKAKFEQHFPFCLLEMLQNTQKVKENFCYYTKKFCIKTSASNIFE
jgi:hypothetical protein